MRKVSYLVARRGQEAVSWMAGLSLVALAIAGIFFG